ncbi:MAG TPA: IPT/TIG domain-containing protein [Terriglobales bacterium]|nr:IPT/TIG domain-containing protein [Terriglobales bacterium]
MRRFAKEASWLWVCLVLLPGAIWGQTTYHLRAAGSSTPGLFQLQTTGPNNTPTVGLMSGPMVAPGDYQVAGFNTQAGVPGTLGYFPTGSKFTFSLWMQTSIAGRGPVYPEAKLYTNNSSGALLCGAKSGSALTTNLQPFNFSCTTATNMGMKTTDRLYLWVGAAQAGIGGPTLRAKLSVEGTLNGNYDSQVSIPNSVVPQIAISPTGGGVNSAVTITGTNLGDGSQSVVTFNGPNPIPAAATWSSGSITATVPLGAFSGNVVLTVAGVPSNGVYFVDTSPSLDTRLLVTSGPIGTWTQVIGSSLGNGSQGSSTLTFTNVATGITVPANVTHWGYNDIEMTVPAGLPGGNAGIVATVNGTASNAVNFLVTPTLNPPSPSSGKVGDAITLTGTAFDPTPGHSTVLFNNIIPAATTNWTNGSVIATVPAGLPAGFASILVKVNGTYSNTGSFMVKPVLLGLSANIGLPGTQVALTGSNFGATQGLSTVTFSSTTYGAVQAPVTAWSDTSINVTVPDGAATGVVFVTVNGTPSNTVPFTVPPPHIDSLSRNQGPGGVRVKISGSNFGTTQGTVMIGSAPMTVMVWKPSVIVATVPCGASSGNIVVTRYGGGEPSNGVLYTVISQ